MATVLIHLLATAFVAPTARTALLVPSKSTMTTIAPNMYMSPYSYDSMSRNYDSTYYSGSVIPTSPYMQRRGYYNRAYGGYGGYGGYNNNYYSPYGYNNYYNGYNSYSPYNSYMGYGGGYGGRYGGRYSDRLTSRMGYLDEAYGPSSRYSYTRDRGYDRSMYGPYDSNYYNGYGGYYDDSDYYRGYGSYGRYGRYGRYY